MITTRRLGRRIGQQRLLAVTIPIYLPTLSTVETRRVRLSLSNLADHDSYFVAPRSLMTDWYTSSFPDIPVVRFPNRHFRSVGTYSRWVLRTSLYRRFRAYEFVLICQTDAVVRRPLPVNEVWDFDYLGAPWEPPKLLGWDPTRRRLKGRGSVAKRVLEVGNGGLSLRRTSVFATRLGFPRFSEHPQEDKAISYFAPDLGIKLGDVGIARRYFMESGAAGWENGDPVPDAYGFHGLQNMNPELEEFILSEPGSGGSDLPTDAR